jgi:hypothetical protein
MNREPWYLHQLTQDELKIFVEKARGGKNNDKAFLGAVAPDAAKRIETACGKKVGKIMLESGAVRVKHGGWLSLVTCYRLQKKNKA